MPAQLFRLQPAGPAWAYKTYRIYSPPSHRRKATCEEVECPNWQRGWLTALDVAVPQQAQLADWIRLSSKRHFSAERVGTTVRFTFPAGQSCFTPHTLPVREPVFLVQGGDWRGNPRAAPTVRHSGIQAWVDDFAENQQAIRDRVERN